MTLEVEIALWLPTILEKFAALTLTKATSSGTNEIGNKGQPWRRETYKTRCEQSSKHQCSTKMSSRQSGSSRYPSGKQIKYQMILSMVKICNKNYLSTYDILILFSLWPHSKLQILLYGRIWWAYQWFDHFDQWYWSWTFRFLFWSQCLQSQSW